MTDAEFVKLIMKFTERELLEQVFRYPEYLTDSYYSMIGSAMRKRFAQLKKERT